MSFVLPDHFITQLRNLRKDYEQETAVTLDDSHQPCTLSLFLGSKDIVSRNKQITFIEQCVAASQRKLSETNKIDSLDAMQNHVTALRLLVAVGLYVQSQIEGAYKIRSGNTAVLKQLINKALGITSENKMDKEAQACCLLSAKRQLAEAGWFEAINAGARVPISEKEWHDFLYFITSQCDLLDKKYLDDYPITTLMMPVFAKPMKYAGYATGYVLGDMIGHSSQFFHARSALTVMVGGCVFSIMGPTSTVGAMLVAGRILDTFCGISLAFVMGEALSLVGKGVGFGVGIPLDLSWKLLYNACYLLKNMNRSYPKLTGTSLIDGHRIMDGAHLKRVDFASLSEPIPGGESEHPIELTVDDLGFTITLNGQCAKFPWLDGKQPQIEELKSAFAMQGKM